MLKKDLELKMFLLGKCCTIKGSNFFLTLLVLDLSLCTVALLKKQFIPGLGFGFA